MARTGVTVDQVASAALAIKVRGSDPTISAVRVELGNVGSYSTISQHLATWRARPVEQVDQRPMPPEVEQHALQLAASLWTAAVRQADHAADAAREQAEDCRRRCDAEVAEARAEIEGLEARVDQLDASVVQLDGQVNYQRERAENISVRRDDATRDLAALRAAHAELQQAYSGLLLRLDAIGQLSPVGVPSPVAASRSRVRSSKPKSLDHS